VLPFSFSFLLIKGPVTNADEPGPSISAPSPVSGDTIKADEDVPVVDAAEAGATEDAAPTPMEVDKEKQEESKNQTPVPSKQPTPQPPQPQQPGQGQQPVVPSQPQQQQQPVKDAAPQMDLLLEASKLPLDVAIFNSARAAGGDDKIRKYLQAVLVVGGTALTPGMAHALESRYASFFPFFLSFLASFMRGKGGERNLPLL
jgi:actin-related protein 8